MEQEQYISALIELHRGLKRQGPGDSSFSIEILKQLPVLPPKPRIADIGCGAGIGALMLAKQFHAKVKAVDFSQMFLDQMMSQAKQAGLEDLIEPIQCDMGSLDWQAETIDLLWSEGAAYSIGFETALKAWRPLMAQNGIAVISELNYFTNDIKNVIVDYMQNLYPGIKTESENVALITASGFECLGLHRLPSEAWWDYYYNPLRENIKSFKHTTDKVMQLVIEETEQEMDFFKTYHNDYGYTFYIMRAVA